MTKREVATKYIECLSNGAVEQIVSLFSADGMVSSPIYGDKPATSFFKELTKIENYLRYLCCQKVDSRYEV